MSNRTMKWLGCVMMAALCLLGTPQSGVAAGTLQMTGEMWMTDETDGWNGQKWLALVIGTDSSIVRKVTLRIGPGKMDFGTGTDSRRTIDVVEPVQPFLLMKKIPGVSEGKVTTVFVGDMAVDEHSRVRFPLGKEEARIVVEPSPEPRPRGPDANFPVTISGARYCPVKTKFHLEIGKRRQLLLEVVDEPALFRILWAGDLDRDGKLDLLIDIDEEAHPCDIQLWLSGRARSGELLKCVTTMERGGC